MVDEWRCQWVDQQMAGGMGREGGWMGELVHGERDGWMGWWVDKKINGWRDDR